MKKTSIRTLYLSIVIILLVALPLSLSAQTTKIAVPSTGPEENALISPKTGRAPFFLFFDGKGHFLEAMKNPAEKQSGGISRTVVALFADKNVTIVIAESIGDKMQQTLTNHHIETTIKTGRAHDAVKTIIED